MVFDGKGSEGEGEGESLLGTNASWQKAKGGGDPGPLSNPEIPLSNFRVCLRRFRRRS